MIENFSNNWHPSTDLTAAVRSIPILGENRDIDSGAVPETIAPMGGAYQFPTSATTVSIVSTSAQDTYGTGTGSWIALIEGLDSNYEEIIETVNLTGLTPALTTQSFLRINSFRTVYHGSGKVNAGTITATVDSKIVRQIDIGEVLDHSAVFTVPDKHVFFPQSITHSVQKSTTSVIVVASKVYVPEILGIVTSSFISVSGQVPTTTGGGGVAFPKIPAKADYWFDAIYASTTNIEAGTIGRGLLVKESYIPKLTNEKIIKESLK